MQKRAYGFTPYSREKVQRKLQVHRTLVKTVETDRKMSTNSNMMQTLNIRTHFKNIQELT